MRANALRRKAEREAQSRAWLSDQPPCGRESVAEYYARHARIRARMMAELKADLEGQLAR